MRKYLGSPITGFAAVVSPLFICFPLIFGLSALSSGISTATVILFLGCILCAVIWCLFLKQISRQLFTWGYFGRNGVEIKTILGKRDFLQYKKCFGCGIGYYTHGFLNGKIGTKIYFVFLSYCRFDEQYRSRINLWKPTQTQIKVKFNKKLYNYLVSVLPKAQARMLICDYERYLKT